MIRTLMVVSLLVGSVWSAAEDPPDGGYDPPAEPEVDCKTKPHKFAVIEYEEKEEQHCEFKCEKYCNNKCYDYYTVECEEQNVKTCTRKVRNDTCRYENVEMCEPYTDKECRQNPITKEVPHLVTDWVMKKVMVCDEQWAIDPKTGEKIWVVKQNSCTYVWKEVPQNRTEIRIETEYQTTCREVIKTNNMNKKNDDLHAGRRHYL